MRITAIERLPRKRRYDVRVDHVLVVPLSPDILFQAGLTVGQEIDCVALKSLEDLESRHSAMSCAMRLLAYRPRSEREIWDALRRRGIREEVTTETLARLRELRLVDDSGFARSYVDMRNGGSPRSRRLLAAELRARGVDKAAIVEPLAEMDEADAAYRAAARKARQVRTAEFREFQKRVGDHLLRRGFGYSLTFDTVKRVWAEGGGTGDESGDLVSA